MFQYFLKVNNKIVVSQLRCKLFLKYFQYLKIVYEDLSREYYTMLLNFKNTLNRSSRQVVCKKSVLKNFTKLTGKHLCLGRVSFLIKRPEVCNCIKKDNLTQLFSCEFYEIFKNTYFYRTPMVAVSESISTHFKSLVSLYISAINMKKPLVFRSIQGLLKETSGMILLKRPIIFHEGL